MKRDTKSRFNPTDVRGLAKLISQVEAGGAEAAALMAEVYAARKGAYCLGVTGPPGAGKSTLVDLLIRKFRADGSRVGVLAIDPSSPFSGGAVLGDRVRMQAHAGDAGVYIRSIGSRGAHGGLSRATRDIVRIYDAYGFDWIIVETVGVGQTELAIMEIADSTLVVLVPEAGDTIQTLKAGLLEIADIFVVNKADREGADRIGQALAAMVEMGRLDLKMAARERHDAEHRFAKSERQHSVPEERRTKNEERSYWHIPVLQSVATKGEGIEGVMKAIASHRAHAQADSARVAHLQCLRTEEFLDLCEAALRARLQSLLAKPELHKLLQGIAAGTANPYQAAIDLIKKLV
ncbi:MAG: methylmalonyl Co-A mutase-associated GTPase MeaB [Deltaproteobacteria bacterium]|nr:methylmalonyl Co-A mutase-associated GTPase MeaB [Deltaproteobacteria bacterium]